VAHTTLAVLPFFGFPQPLDFLDSVIGRDIARIDRILPRAELSLCCYEYPESSYGASDGGFPCYELATAHHLASGLEYCEEHFEEVCR
jgi:hypothetical protein